MNNNVNVVTVNEWERRAAEYDEDDQRVLWDYLVLQYKQQFNYQ